MVALATMRTTSAHLVQCCCCGAVCPLLHSNCDNYSCVTVAALCVTVTVAVLYCSIVRRLLCHSWSQSGSSEVSIWTQVADVHEELHQLEARLSVLSDQYSGTTEMYSTHMDQNTAITNQLVEKVEQCAVPAELMEGMQAQLEDLRMEFEEMAELTQQGSNAVFILEEKLQQSLGESACKVTDRMDS